MLGWGLWGMAATQLGLAAYLVQVVPGRERIALAALGAGLIGEATVSVLQWPWVLPALAEAQRRGELDAVVGPGLSGDLAERIANGGLYGSFTLANTLAAYLLVATPAVAGAARRFGIAFLLCAVITIGVIAAYALIPASAASGLRMGYWWWAAPLGCSMVVLVRHGCTALTAWVAVSLAGVAFIGTSSKGAYVALAAAAAWCWWRYRAGWSRWLAPAVVALGVGTPFAVHRIGDLFRASADVRIGYWEAAATLARERPLTGHGLESYGELSSPALPEWADWSMHAHSDPLEAAAEAGIPVALLLVGLLAWVTLRRSTAAAEPVPADEPSTLVSWTVPIALGVLVLYWGGLGTLIDNVSWWPGHDRLVVGDIALAPLAWCAVVGALMAVSFRLLLGLPRPPAWCLELALASLAMHCVLDFDLQSGAVVGSVVACASLAPGRVRGLGSDERRLGWAPLGVAALVLSVGIAALVAAMSIGARAHDAAAIADDVQELGAQGTTREQAAKAVAELVARARLEAPPPGVLGNPAQLSAVVESALAEADAMAPWDYPLRTRLIELAAPGATREERTAALAAVRPASAMVFDLWAQDAYVQAQAAEHAHSADAVRWWRAAVERRRSSVALRPLAVRGHRVFAELLDDAAEHDPERAEQLKGEATAERQWVARMESRVHPRNR
jgi:hypothetical protein